MLVGILGGGYYYMGKKICKFQLRTLTTVSALFLFLWNTVVVRYVVPIPFSVSCFLYVGCRFAVDPVQGRNEVSGMLTMCLCG